MATSLHVPVTTERRASNPHDWVIGLCDQFTAASGWALEFVQLDDHAERQSEQLNWAWHADVSDGEERLGTMFLAPPAEGSTTVTFPTAYQLADLLALQLNRSLRLQRLLKQQSHEIGAFVNPEEGMGQQSFGNRLRGLLRAGVTLTNFRSAALFVLDPDGSGVRLRFTHPQNPNAIPSAVRPFEISPPDYDTLQHGLAIVRRGEFERYEDWLPREASVGVSVAVQNDSGPIGTMWLFDRRHHEPDGKELALLRGFGRQIADAFERLVLLRDSETKERMSRELDIVASATPCCQDSSTTYPGCEVAVRLCSHHQVGGDLCEAIPVDEDRTIFVVGDASGDSLPAAVVMQTTRGALHALLAEHGKNLPTVNDLIGKLNQAVARVTATQQFISFILAMFDRRTKQMTFSNAGHPPPVLLRDGEVSHSRSHGLLLGVLDDATYGSEQLQLQSGDQMVFFTDGITEARGQSEEMFQHAGVTRSLKEAGQDSARNVLEAIWSDYEKHTGGENNDDRTLMVIRIE